MQFRNVGDTWKPIDPDERLTEAMKYAGIGLLLLSVPVIALALVAIVFFAFLRVENPFLATLAIAVRYWNLLILLPAIGAVRGFLAGWRILGSKSFEEVAIETLQSINDRLESIADAINEKDAYPDEMREELSGISAGLKRLDEIEEQIKSIRD